MKTEYKILTGNEACTLGALAAGMNFYAGYPITPATEIMENCSQLLPKHGGVFMQMEDELASMGAVIGASLAGAKAMTATSGPGFTLMQENFGYGTYIETPCVVVDVMRDGPSTGTGTHPLQGDIMQVKWGRSGGNHPVIALAPASVSELYNETVRAFNLAEKLRMPVVVLSDAIMAHMSEKVAMQDASNLKLEKRKTSTEPKGRVMNVYEDDGTGIPALPTYGDGRRWCVAGLTHDDSGMPVTGDPALTQKLVTKLNSKVTRYIDDTVKISRTDWVVVDETHEAVISKELFDEVQARMKEYREYEVIPSERNPLRRKVICGTCGHAMRLSNTKNAKYHCNTASLETGYGCSHDGFLQTDVNEAVVTLIRTYASYAVSLERLAVLQSQRRQAEAKQARRELAVLQSRKGQLDKALQDLYETLMDGSISKETYLARKQAINAQIQELSGSIAALEKTSRSPDTGRDSIISKYKEYTELETLTAKVVRELVKNVVLYPDGRMEINLLCRDELEAILQEVESISEVS